MNRLYGVSYLSAYKHYMDIVLIYTSRATFVLIFNHVSGNMTKVRSNCTIIGMHQPHNTHRSLLLLTASFFRHIVSKFAANCTVWQEAYTEFITAFSLRSTAEKQRS